MVGDFKKFLMRGNVVDLAVAVVIGAAFKTIISSLVKDIIMPPIGVMMGGVDFTDLKYIIQEAAGEDVAEVAIGYGAFAQTIIDFIIIAAAIFVFVKMYEKLQKKEEAAPAKDPEPTKEETLLTEIRDLLKK